MIVTRCPGSCGELIQGIIFGGEKLISYPINCYSYVKISEGKRDNELLYSKAYKAIENVFNYFKEDIDFSKKLKIEINSDIPIGKGMASSTADLGATILATSKYLGKNISDEEIAKICTKIEPTDSTVFSDITLFDHLKASYFKRYGRNFKYKVLILEGKYVIDTINFRKIDKSHILDGNISNVRKALKDIEIGIENNDIKKVGEGAILSALANEDILKKPGLEIIIERALKFGAYGLNIAHSGSVIGIIFEDKYFDKEVFIENIKKEDFMNDYINIREYETVNCGVEIVNMEG
ncbi:hypothetical protein GOQ29_07635 [Clostridium sp. D2Q-14]|uniref:GHMP family kinase ATP-binding protein n=1 Tax=Anaeromonas gelatinilytica TaxID=2683194 RepID=UPI00193B9381|nr:hypothetical protein [Anaeromonas gelatinilytica]MBS4535491.1 hypothetical protein [Anaeromonas gelatinilytica]